MISAWLVQAPPEEPKPLDWRELRASDIIENVATGIQIMCIGWWSVERGGEVLPYFSDEPEFDFSKISEWRLVRSYQPSLPKDAKEARSFLLSFRREVSFGARFAPRPLLSPKERKLRNGLMWLLRQDGMTLVKIGEAFGVSYKRVQQVLEKLDRRMSYQTCKMFKLDPRAETSRAHPWLPPLESREEARARTEEFVKSLVQEWGTAEQRPSSSF